MSIPDMYFFRHQAGRSGIKPGDKFGPKYFKVWWDKACKNSPAAELMLPFSR